jgi:hypothetical protein
MTQTTKIVPQRRGGLQALKGVWQRLSMTLLVMLLTRKQGPAKSKRAHAAGMTTGSAGTTNEVLK